MSRLLSNPDAAAAVEFFLYEVPKVLLLLTGVVFVVGVLRTFVTRTGPARAGRLTRGEWQHPRGAARGGDAVLLVLGGSSLYRLRDGWRTAGSCTRCKEALRVVRHVAEQSGLAVEVVKEESLERMAAIGLMATPGRAIDGKLVLSGRIPRAEEIREFLGVDVSHDH